MGTMDTMINKKQDELRGAEKAQNSSRIKHDNRMVIEKRKVRASGKKRE